jgi:GntR family transcriptional regulator/MocR family aminotransferase
VRVGTSRDGEFSHRALGIDLYLDRSAGGVRAGLTEAFREAIRSGRLAPGSRLPSTRSLALDLGLARNTIARVYSDLIVEGWLSARHGSGTHVAERACDLVRRPAELWSVPTPRRFTHDLRPGRPDVSSFPRHDWIRATRRALTSAANDAFGYLDPYGTPELRHALAEYLGRARGVRTRPDNIIVCCGTAEGLRLVAAALKSLDTAAVAVESFGLPAQRRALESAGLRTTPIEVGVKGADVASIASECDVRAVLLTPSHQFPLGVALHSSRRAAVIDWARRTGSIIIEDDYDGEFRYDRDPVGALQGLDPDHVIYMGTASKSLAPGLRLGWLVVPGSLVDLVAQQKGETEVTSGAIDQLAMAELIHSGAYDRHIRGMRRVYGRRREQLVTAVAEQCPGTRLSGLSAGLHVLAEIAGGNESSVARAGAWQRLGVAGLSEFKHPDSVQELDGLVIGFGSPSASSWSASLDALVGLLP